MTRIISRPTAARPAPLPAARSKGRATVRAATARSSRPGLAPVALYGFRFCTAKGQDRAACAPRATRPTAREEEQGRLLSTLTSVGQTVAGLVAASLLWVQPVDATPLVGNDNAPALPRAASAVELASRAEDGLLELLKQTGAQMDAAVQGVTSALQVVDSSDPEAIAEVEQARELVKEVWEVVDQNYLDARGTGFSKARWSELRDEELGRASLRDTASAYRAIKSMLARGLSDPYTRFITPKEFEVMRKYDLSGVGLNLGTSEEYVRKLQTELPRGGGGGEQQVWVLGLIKGSAADFAGMSQGDEILSVDGESTRGKSPFQVSSQIQGGPDSPRAVDIAVAKAASGKVERVTLQRPASQALQSPVKSELRKEGRRKVGYIRLSSFNALAQADVAQAVRSLTAAGADELVLDLRDNRGGLVTTGVEVARLFLDSGSTVVITQGAQRDDRVLAPGPPLTSVPLTVLVNEHTASASEILAGALHDNCRATLVGRTTYGKGLIQSVYELSDTSGIVITVGKYLTPAGSNIDSNGIPPDFPRLPSSSERQATLKACIPPA